LPHLRGGSDVAAGEGESAIRVEDSKLIVALKESFRELNLLLLSPPLALKYPFLPFRLPLIPSIIDYSSVVDTIHVSTPKELD